MALTHYRNMTIKEQELKKDSSQAPKTEDKPYHDMQTKQTHLGRNSKRNSKLSHLNPPPGQQLARSHGQTRRDYHY